MSKRYLTACVRYTMLLAVAGSAQVVVLNEPTEWITQRSDSMLVRAQVDTGQIESKKVTVKVQSVKAGRKRTLASKTFTVDDFSEEFYLGKAGEMVLGGRDYLLVEWSIPGKNDKGECAPVGIVNLDRLGASDTAWAVKVDGTLDVKAVSAAVKQGQFVELGGITYALVWNKQALGLAFKRTDDNDKSLCFVFDGKNGKNAFLSYPDREVRYFAAGDSVGSLRYKRAFKDGKVEYSETTWNNETFVSRGDGLCVVSVPMHDLGVVSFGGRTVGFAVFAKAADGTVAASMPAKAKADIPGTWGNLVMKE